MIRTVARPLLASAFAVDGAQMLLNSKDYEAEAKAITGTLHTALPAQAKAYIPSDDETTVRVIGTTKVVASALLATGKAPRLAAATLAAVQVPTALARHAFWKAPNTEERKEDIRGLITDAALLGALTITSADTAGKPGLKWRVQKAMPGKSEQQKMLENAQEQSRELAHNAQVQAQGLFEKTKDVASQVSEKVTDYVDEHQDEWLEAAENFREQAVDFGQQASAAASDFASDFAQDSSKKLSSARKTAKKQAKKWEKQAAKAEKRARKALK